MRGTWAGWRPWASPFKRISHQEVGIDMRFIHLHVGILIMRSVKPKGASDHRGAWQIERRTMRLLLFVGTLIAGLSGGIASGQARASALGSVHLTHAVIADGKPLAAGLYLLRLTDDESRPSVGKSPNADRWIEFVKDGRVAAREVATVVSVKDTDTIALRSPPLANQSRVDVLKEGNYVRISINRGGTKYIIKMPPAGTQHLPPRPPTGLSVR
jgi:hypothetical protein